MTPDDLEPIVTIALMAAQADGTTSPEELTRLKAAVARLGVAHPDSIVERLGTGRSPLAEVAQRLSDDAARRLAYQTALLVCNADGPANPAEVKFLEGLRTGLGLTPMAVGQVEETAATLAKAPVASDPAVPAGTAPTKVDAALDERILQQAMLTAALELLPEGLANIAILPLQLRLVYQVGQHYGQQLDARQIKDLTATLGIGAAAQVMEGVVRKVVSSVGGGIFGGLIGGTAGIAAGAAVTFATTYALGHAAQQYYAQGRRLSADDLRALFARFKGEAEALFPKVRDQVQAKARTLNIENVRQMLS